MIEFITAQEAQQMMQSGEAILVDIREINEYG